MCRKANHCVELGLDPTTWSHTSPLALPSWIEGQLDIFQEAVHLYVSGDRHACLVALSRTRSQEMRDWYLEHGQVAGTHRARIIAKPKPLAVNVVQRDPERSPKKLENAVYSRDGYRCRYCGTKLVSGIVLKALIQALNTVEFRRGPRNIDTHGILCIFYPSADHVIPWNYGGRTEMNNLVTSCVPCNFGKDRFTVEQIGIENPLNREPIVDEWDGMLSRLRAIKQTARIDAAHRN